MELQSGTIRVKKMVETLIQKTTISDWRFPPSDSIGLFFEKELRRLPQVFGLNEIDDERVVDYIVYQIYRVRENIQIGAWQTGWVFSDYAKRKFKQQFLSEKGKSGMNYYINIWLKDAGLSRAKLTGMIKEPKANPLENMVYLESEEPIKQRFLNTAEGLALCQKATTGWSPYSATCNNCNNSTSCMELTERKYPELMGFRREKVKGN